MRGQLSRRRGPAAALGCLTLATGLVVIGNAQSPQEPVPQEPPRQPDTVTLVLTGEPGSPPRLAVPDFIALSKDAETIEAARTIAQVLWNDLNFEREFGLIPRDTYATIPPARTWRR